MQNVKLQNDDLVALAWTGAEIIAFADTLAYVLANDGEDVELTANDNAVITKLHSHFSGVVQTGVEGIPDAE